MLQQKIIAVFAVLLAGIVRAAELPKVLDHVPANAQAVFVIRDMKELAGKVSAVGTRIGLPLPENLIDTMTHHIGVEKGLDEKGSMAVAIMPGEKHLDDNDEAPLKPEPILILPAADVQLLLKPFKPGTAKDGISKVLMPNDPDETGYVAIVGNFVAFAHQRDYLERFLAQKKMLAGAISAETAAGISGNDLSLYANVPELSKAYGKLVDGILKLITQTSDNENNWAGGGISAVATREFMNSYFAAIRNFLTDAKSTLVTAKITDAGVTIGASGAFEKDSAWGKYVAGHQQARPLSLAGLADAGKMWGAGAVKVDSGNFSTILTEILEGISQVPEGEGAKTKTEIARLQKTLALEKELAGLSSGGSFAVFAPTDVEKHGYVSALFFVETSDAEKYVTLSNQLLKLAAESAAERGLQLSSETVEHTAALGDLDVSRSTTTFKIKDPQHKIDPDGMTAGDLMKQITGLAGLVIHTAVEKNRVMFVISSDEKFAEQTIGAMRKNSDALAKSAEIQSVKDVGLKNPTMMLYVNADRIIAFAEKAARKNKGAGKGPIKLEDPISSPVVLTAAASGESAGVELFVPMTTLSTSAGYLIKAFGPMMSPGE